MLLMGSATADITPTSPVELAGFAARTGPYARIASPLRLQAFAFAGRQASAGEAILVCADLLWWGAESRARIAAAVSDAVGVSPDAVVLHASHTHAAPHTEPAFSPRLGKVDLGYVAELESRTVAACRRAAEYLVPVELSISHGWSDAGIARRGGGPRGPIVPDPDRRVDNTVRVITARSEGEVQAALVHFACHPVTVQGHTVSADFPGVVRDRIAAYLGTGSVAMLQSCAGDVNPSVLVDGTSFHAGDDDDAVSAGSALADAATSALASGEKPLHANQVEFARLSVDLPLSRVAEPGGGVWAELNERRAALAVTEPRLVLSGLRLGQLTLLGMNAEVTTEVGDALKAAIGDELLPLTCSDGMIGYLVGPGDLARGGYEAEESYAYVYRDGPFAPDALPTAVQAVERLLQALR
ncbi:hypothetical protein [Kribbella sp. NPDC004875]|uniref:hypothetical protein n=1 Tax=Kribbella sp. NPDC004875 TaxID=3364107 RepID=UPI0036B1864A